MKWARTSVSVSLTKLAHDHQQLTKGFIILDDAVVDGSDTTGASGMRMRIHIEARAWPMCPMPVPMGLWSPT